MKKLSLLVFIIFFGILDAISQSDFRCGYIIKNNQDTIHGLIDYKGNNANAKKCLFKSDESSVPIEYTPDQLKAYRFCDSKYYISRMVTIDGSEKLLFLEYLINGIVDVFYLKDNWGSHYFIEKDDGILYQLKNEEKEIVVDDAHYFRESKEYVGVLKYMFVNSPSISKKIENVNLNHKSLINIAKDYHKEVCDNEECIIYEKKIPNTIKSFGFLMGLGFTSFKITRNSVDSMFLGDYKSKFILYPTVGFYYRTGLPMVNEHLSFQYEGTFSYKKSELSSLYIEPLYNLHYTNRIEWSQFDFCNAGILKYEYNKGKIRPVLQLGGYFDYSLVSKYIRDLDVDYSWGKNYYSKKYEEKLNYNIAFGLSFGFGLISKINNNRDIFVDLRYQRGYDIGSLLYSNTNTILMVLGLKI
jgi:hypothetical protein